MENIELKLSFKVYDDPEKLDEEGKKLLQAAKQCANDAYAPYSNFNVGCALLLEDGTLITGSNQENAAYPSGLCAERVAFFAASANHPNVKIKRIAVVARRNGEQHYIEASPCGACRQVMMEYEDKQEDAIEVILIGDNGNLRVIPSVETLLPFKFTSRSL